MSGFKQAFRKGIPGMLADIADLLRQILDDQRAYHQYMVEHARREDAQTMQAAQDRHPSRYTTGGLFPKPPTPIRAVPK
jgi:hypothetical protein